MMTLPKTPRSLLTGATALVAAAGLTLALAPIVRGNGPGNGVNANTNSVGTMPNLGVMPPSALPPRLAPSFFLTGPRDQLLESLLDINGEAEVHFFMDPMTGQPVVEFRGGALDLLLSETYLATGVVRVGVLAPDGSAMYAACETAGMLSPVSTVQPAGTYDLPYADWYGTHYADYQTRVLTMPGNARRMVHTLDSGGGLLTVGQHLQ